ncbi:MAG: hypothetical protein AW07_02111 [Candidatus Accumulibacter sp. SK-11]|nr:MAG: hypothetical protein AW07_02111 [Candidatus Accumulibacter sp. SK-11]
MVHEATLLYGDHDEYMHCWVGETVQEATGLNAVQTV